MLSRRLTLRAQLTAPLAAAIMQDAWRWWQVRQERILAWREYDLPTACELARGHELRALHHAFMRWPQRVHLDHGICGRIAAHYNAMRLKRAPAAWRHLLLTHSSWNHCVDGS